MKSFSCLQTTGLTGMIVAKTPHYTLGVLYGKILRALEKLPKDYAYKNYTQQLIEGRSAIVKSVIFIIRLPCSDVPIFRAQTYVLLIFINFITVEP